MNNKEGCDYESISSSERLTAAYCHSDDQQSYTILYVNDQPAYTNIYDELPRDYRSKSIFAEIEEVEWMYILSGDKLESFKFNNTNSAPDLWGWIDINMSDYKLAFDLDVKLTGKND